MTVWTLIRRGLAFHWRNHLAVLLAAALGIAILVGALWVGDSVRGSLRSLALRRLGAVQVALAAPDRFFRADLARDIEGELHSVRARAAPALLLTGVAVTPNGVGRANGVQVLGVDDRFWPLGPAEGGQPPESPGGTQSCRGRR